MWFVMAVRNNFIWLCVMTTQITSGSTLFPCLFCMILAYIWIVLDTETEHQGTCSCLLPILTKQKHHEDFWERKVQDFDLLQT